MIEATIECVVNRPIYYRGKKYERNDLFYINPNNFLHRRFLRTNRVFQVEEERYKYIYVGKIPIFLSKSVECGEEIDLSELSIERKLLFIKRGKIKKIISNDIPNLSINEVANLLNLTYKELKDIYKAKFDEYLPHHNKKIDSKMFKNIETSIGKIEIPKE